MDPFYLGDCRTSTDASLFISQSLSLKPHIILFFTADIPAPQRIDFKQTLET